MKNKLALIFLGGLMMIGCGKDRTYEYEELTSYNHWIYDVLKENYLWRDTLTELEWKDYFGKPDEFLKKVTKNAKDPWSYVTVDTVMTDPHKRGNYIDHTNSYGFDFEVWTDPTGMTTKQFARVITVYPGSVADSANLKRGDFIRSLNGTQVNNGNAQRLVKGLGGTLEVMHVGIDVASQEFVWLDTLKKHINPSRPIKDKAVWMSKLMPVSDLGIVGYVMFSHLDDIDAITEAMDAVQGANHLVLDFRLANYGSLEGAKTLFNIIKSLHYDNMNFIVGNYTQGAAEWVITWLRQELGKDYALIVGQKTAGQYVTLANVHSDTYMLDLNYANDTISSSIIGGIPADSTVIEKNFLEMGSYGELTEPILYTILSIMSEIR